MKQNYQEIIEYCLIDKKENLIPQLLNILYIKNIQSIIVEGGKTLLESFINESLWDEARVFIGIKEFGKGLKAPELKKEPIYIQKINTDSLNLYKND